MRLGVLQHPRRNVLAALAALAAGPRATGRCGRACALAQQADVVCEACAHALQRAIDLQ